MRPNSATRAGNRLRHGERNIGAVPVIHNGKLVGIFPSATSCGGWSPKDATQVHLYG